MNSNVFSFRKVTYEEILNEINSLDTAKSTQLEDIPFKIIKDNSDIFDNLSYKTLTNASQRESFLNN